MALDASLAARRVPNHPDPFGEEHHEDHPMEEQPQYVPLIAVDVPEVRVFHFLNFKNRAGRKIGHMALSLCTLGLFLLALRAVWWRILSVNREALSLKEEMREIDEKVLNTTFAFSRAQSLFEECFISDENFILNGTGLPADVCHSLIPSNEPKPHVEYFWTILGLTRTQMCLAPVVIAAAAAFVLIQLLASFLHPIYSARLFSCLALLRIANALPTLLVLICGCIISNLYHAENPGFPASWLPVIRKFTEVYAWQLGPPLWTAGFVFQIVTVVFDLSSAKKDTDFNFSPLGVPS